MKHLKKLQLIFNSILPVSKNNQKFIINYNYKLKIPKGIKIAIVSPYAEIDGDKNCIYAYLSLTEINKNSQNISYLSDSNFISYNKQWSSYLIDITANDVKKIIQNELTFIINNGFKNIFIDTVDGIEALSCINPKNQIEYKKSALDIFKLIHESISGKIIINRGFYIYPLIRRYIDGILIESLFFKKIDNKWEKRDEQEMQWIKEKVKEIKKDGKFLLAVDYAKLNFLKKIYYQQMAKFLNIDWITLDENLIQ